jgi:excinuclease ABC subunit A
VSKHQLFPTSIKITGARQNNLKNLSFDLPLEKMVCITGPSGSGKSSLAFDTLYAEGYRRYVESLSTYARQFFERIPKPDVDSIENIAPSIALQQTNPVRNSRSTVGTQTEVYDYLRLLFAKLGQTHCPECQKPIRADTPQSAADSILSKIGEGSDRALVGFLLPSATAADQLLEKGFVRRLKSLSDNEVIEIETDRGKLLKEKTPIIFDRLVVSLKDRHRLVEALEGSFRLGEGLGFVSLMGAQSIQKFSSRFECTACGVSTSKPQPLLFSFNSPLGACDDCKGFGNILDYDKELIIPNTRLSLQRGAIDPFTKPMMKAAQKKLFDFARAEGISLSDPWQELEEDEQKALFYGRGKFKGIRGAFVRLEDKKYKLHVRVFLRRYQSSFLCQACKGARLKSAALNVKIKNKTIADVCEMSLADLESWFSKLSWSDGEKLVNREILRQIGGRLSFLNRMGLSYLTLARLSRTLSGGESQRINLANQLGAELSGTLYVLDEPSIGLHAVDRDRLIQSLKDLVTMGNSVVVVEHDLDTIQAGEWVIELGPQSGSHGGELVFQGSRESFQKSATLTAQYLRGERFISLPKTYRTKADDWLTLQGCSQNNLKNVNLKIPLNRFVGVSGVSGSGKSTLIHQTLFQAMARLFHQSTDPIGRFQKLFGSERVRGAVMLDQSPIARSGRSIPLTIIGAFDEVRSTFAKAAKNQGRALEPKHFSFNVPGGRCETCSGEGVVTTEMYFLDDVTLPCEDCDGKRYKKEILEIFYRSKNIHDVFNMTVSEAKKFFADNSSLVDRMETLERVGLGYLKLGQNSHGLSGGESQRLRIASELMDRRKKGYLYIFDEPTTGLHISEVSLLIQLLQSLVDSGNTVIVIEHNLDVLKCVDWLIELGPGAGAQGGQIVAEGPPEEVAKLKTQTSPFLKNALGISSKAANLRS